MPAIPVIPFDDGRTNIGVPQYNGLFQEAQKNRPSFAGQIFENIGPMAGGSEKQPSGYPSAFEALGGLGEGGAYERYRELHPLGGASPSGRGFTGIGGKVYDFLQGLPTFEGFSK